MTYLIDDHDHAEQESAILVQIRSCEICASMIDNGLRIYARQHAGNDKENLRSIKIANIRVSCKSPVSLRRQKQGQPHIIVN